MARYEKYSLASLITTVAVFWYFCMKMLDGMSLVSQPTPTLFKIYVTTVILFIITEIINALLFLARPGLVQDERDYMIKSKAERNGNFVIIAAINIVLFIVLAEGTFSNYHGPTHIDLTSPESLLFHLLGVLVLGTIVERVSTLIYYRL